MDGFVEFSGAAETRGEALRLIAAEQNGFIEFRQEDVRLENGAVHVRNGAVALAIDEPARGNAADRPPAETLREACPSGITCCIGNLHLCCDDFRVIGSCAGAWGCSRPKFIP